MDELVARIRDFARRHDAKVVSSAFLSARLDVDARTIAAALRRHDVRPQHVESARGYVVAELLRLGHEADPSFVEQAARGDYCVDPAPTAVEGLSAGAGHDMTPALRAAGMLP